MRYEYFASYNRCLPPVLQGKKIVRGAQKSRPIMAGWNISKICLLFADFYGVIKGFVRITYHIHTGG